MNMMVTELPPARFQNSARTVQNGSTPTVHIIVSSRFSRFRFEAESALARSTRRLVRQGSIKLHPVHGPQINIPEAFNQLILQAAPDDILLFVSEDVWVDDWLMPLRLQEALKTFDLVSIAGTKRFQPHQRYWNLKPGWPNAQGYVSPDAWEHHDHLSGCMVLGLGPGQGEIIEYGHTTSRVQMLNTAFIASKASTLQNSYLLFDVDFATYLYDIDLCLRARQKGLELGTWPIAVTLTAQPSIHRPSLWRQAVSQFDLKWTHHLIQQATLPSK